MKANLVMPKEYSPHPLSHIFTPPVLVNRINWVYRTQFWKVPLVGGQLVLNARARWSVGVRLLHLPLGECSNDYIKYLEIITILVTNCWRGRTVMRRSCKAVELGSTPSVSSLSKMRWEDTEGKYYEEYSRDDDWRQTRQKSKLSGQDIFASCPE